jgi:hypothetical protein
LSRALAGLALGVLAHAQAWADGKAGDAGTLYLQAGVYVHYENSPDHQGPPLLVGLELERPSRVLFGLSLFNNSFGQFSQYLYTGRRFSLSSWSPHLHAKVTAGVIHGYRGEFQDKLAFNSSGFAPAVIPSIGWKKNGLGVDLVVLADAALMVAVGVDL